MDKRKALIEWLESMPWWDELPYANLKAENDALGELLSPLVDVELERDKLKTCLASITCGECGKNMLECECDEDSDTQFTGGTTPAYFSEQDKTEDGE